ncbi:MAG TPA: 3-deoxy-manno-octulosonate cytidylyltransferase [Hydrogenophaga sp.]
MTSRRPFTVLIPARLASSRLPNKPLADIGGLPMVVRVARQAAQSDATTCVVAADDPRIVDACLAHGVRALLTRTDHLSGSDRLAQACEMLDLEDDALVVNVQGDEPLIEPALVNAVAQELESRSDCVMSTAAHPLQDMTEFTNPNVVKVVLDKRRTALYFSRAPIPCWREGLPTFNGEANAVQSSPLRHIGLYAYRTGFLRLFPKLTPAPMETVEALEQLRVLWHGERIAVHISQYPPSAGVDTPDDLARVRRLFPTP